MLSQRQGNPPKLYPCAFFSRKLNPTEQNYDVGNCELLAMKAAFEEWRHWLEGARHSVIRVSQAHYNSSIISYGGPHSDLTLSRSFKTAPSVIPPSLCINYLLDSFNHCPFHNAPGRTWPLTCDGFTILSGPHYHPHRNRSLLQGLQADTTPETSHCPRNGRSPVQLCLQVLWSTRGYSV